MFTQIVVLYICYLLNLPTWCRVLMYAGIMVNLVQFGFGLCDGLRKKDNADS